MIDLLKTELAYCNQCNLPGVVGIFRIKGWNHVADLCSGCLVSLANKIDMDVNWRKDHG